MRAAFRKAKSVAPVALGAVGLSFQGASLVAENVKAAQTSRDALWDPSWVETHGERTIAKRVAAPKDLPLKLYTSWFCPFAQRAWIAVEEKQLDYSYVEINPYEVDDRLPGGYTKKQLPLEVKKAMYPDFIASSPRGLVPSVDCNGDKVWESLHVVQYIDERFDHPPYFLPRNDPVKRAHVRIWSDFVTEKMQRNFYVHLMDQDPAAQAKAKDVFFQECRTFARAMSKDGPYFLGKEISMVDIALFPFWQRFLWVGRHYRGLEMPKDKEFERLQRWWEATCNRPAFKATLVCQDRLISSYGQYSRNEGTSDCAKGLQSSLKQK
ncbi:Glutathione S-transferase L3 (AtGSTL3) (GST class-lambda member 3) [Durusdinium trenchii]|uniref:Glutathione S-transferase L3 (AtGSTL3) (GST class-lambda member 3) n=1 Tax=Durusdinium trenchii TaxID=1381693 RepID=A0ABP0J2U5_9DINO